MLVISSQASPRSLRRLRNFQLLVRLHYRHYHQVQDYADLLHCSPKTLSNSFSAYTNTTPLKIIHRQLISEAQRLIRLGQHSVKAIGFHLGFDDPHQFSRFYKRCCGQSISQMRRLAERQLREELPFTTAPQWRSFK